MDVDRDTWRRQVNRAHFPYACLRWEGHQIELDEKETRGALRDGLACGCGRCLCCRVVDYVRSNAIDAAALADYLTPPDRP